MIPNGALVYYKNKAALSSQDKDRIEIQFGDKSTARVREKDVELIHPGPLTRIPPAPESEADQKTAWEMTAGASLTLQELCELLYGQTNPANLLASRQLLESSLYFYLDNQTVMSRSQEELKTLIQKQQKREQDVQDRADFIKRARNNRIEDGDQRFWGEIEAFALGRSQKSGTLKDIGLAESMEEAHSWLLRTGLWSSAHNPHPSRAKHPTKAPDLPLEDTDPLPRMDLRHMAAWAIDNAWSHDPDDAISWDGEAIWVHIADPASGIPPDSPADREAANRGATLYLPEGSIPMLPDAALTKYGLGLSAESKALSFRIKLDQDNLPSEISILPSLVRVQRLSYASAEAYLGSGPLAQLNHLAALRQAQRQRNGAVDINIPEVRVWVEKGEINIQTIPEYRSSAIVREMMILASEAAARWAFERNLPFPYYSQEAPGNQEKLPAGLPGEFAKRRLMKAGKSGVQPHAHQGLGVSMYAQSSSPLRRYSDLLAHQQIRAWLGNEAKLTSTPPLAADELSLRLGTAAAQTAALRKAERASIQHWTLAWLQEHEDWKGTGTVVQSTSESLVYIPELGLETRIKQANLEIGMELNLRFLKADLPNLETWFAID